MNLKKYFNFNYFKENVKKSRGVLAFFFGVVPILNIIALIISLSNNGGLIDFSDISLLTQLGLYIIPIVLSVALFGFVFKQKSVDFVMSKPLSRKSIYLTNTIGGSILIAVFILLNALIFGLFGLFSNTLIVPLALILDYIIFWLISYIFVFSVANLALTFAGNFIASIVLILLIICLIPFLNVSTNVLQENYRSDSVIICKEENCKPKNFYCYENESCLENLKENKYYFSLLEKENYTFTTPLYMFNNSESILSFNTKSLIKMTILSLAYIAIGFYTFKNRKMENNETSFKNEFIHYLVKTLTFIPICFIAYLFIKEGGDIAWLVIIALIIIYYIVYDLITRKEIYKLSKSLFVCLVSFGIIIGSFAIIDKTTNEIILDAKNIDSIDIEILGEYETINDKKTINSLIAKSIEKENAGGDIQVNRIIVNAGNKKYYSYISIDSELIKKLSLEKLTEDKKNFPYEKTIYASFNGTSIPITKEFKKLISNVKDKNADFNSDITLYLKTYQNHKYIDVAIPLTISEELYKYVINTNNKSNLKTLKESEYSYYLSLYDSTNTFTAEDNYVFNYVFNSNYESFLNYLSNNKVELTPNYIEINFYNNKQYSIIINDIQKFKNEFDRNKKMVENNREYQELIKEYQDNLEGKLYD